MPNLDQEIKFDIIAGLNALALGNANTAMARVKWAILTPTEKAKIRRGAQVLGRALTEHNRIGANYFVS